MSDFIKEIVPAIIKGFFLMVLIDWRIKAALKNIYPNKSKFNFSPELNDQIKMTLKRLKEME